MWKPEARSSFCEVNLRPENICKNQSINFIAILFEKQKSEGCLNSKLIKVALTPFFPHDIEQDLFL